MNASRIIKTAIVMAFTAVNAAALAQTASPTSNSNETPTPAPVPDKSANTQPPEILGEGLSGIKKIYGLVSESSNPKSKELVTYEFWYTSPQTFAVRYAKPARLAGSTISFDGNTFRLVFRETKAALVLRGLAPDQKLIRNTVMNFGEEASYAVENVGAEKSVGIQSPDGEALGFSGFNIEFEKQFSFPHKLQFQTKSGSYKREFTRLDLNPEKSPVPPREFIPLDVEAFDWNLALRNVCPSGSSLDLDFGIDLPNKIAGFEQEKCVYQKGTARGIAMRFKSTDGRYIVLAAHNVRYPSAIPQEIGVPIKASDGIEGQMITGPPMNIYTFAKGDARFYLIGNASIFKLLAFSAKIPAKPVVESPPKKTEPRK